MLRVCSALCSGRKLSSRRITCVYILTQTSTCALGLVLTLWAEETGGGQWVIVGDVNLWVSHNSIPVLEVTVQLKIDFQFKQFSDQMILDYNAVCIMLYNVVVKFESYMT